MTAGRSLFGTPAIAGRANLRSGVAGETRPGAAAAAALAAALSIAVAAAGATLLIRRLSGGFSLAPSSGVAWAVAIAGIPLMLAVEAAARIGGDRWPAGFARGGLLAAALATAPLATSATWPSRAFGLGGTVVALLAALRPPAGWRPPRIGGEWLPRRLGDGEVTRPAVAGDGWRRETKRSGGLAATPLTSSDPQVGAVAADTLPAGFRQRLERYETASGDDCIRGQVMLSVAAGSRTGHAHVGFCPAFTTLPTVEVSTDCDFVEAEVAAAEILPWGIRVECRLSEPAEEPLQIPVAIRAVRPA